MRLGTGDKHQQFCDDPTEVQIMMLRFLFYILIAIPIEFRIKIMKVFILFTFFYFLASSQIQPASPNIRQNCEDSQKDDDHTSSSHKCQNVKCEPGYFCFHGRCKKIDYECIDKKCDKGFRCKNGECIKQAHTPQKQICAPLGLQLSKLRCTPELKTRCLTDKSSIKVCGYYANRTYQDFDNQCSACSDGSQIRFYFKTSCQWAPRICKQSQECLNGVCTVLFNEPVFANYRTCNENKDCKPHERCGGHRCIDRREMFDYLQSKNHERNKDKPEGNRY